MKKILFVLLLVGIFSNSPYITGVRAQEHHEEHGHDEHEEDVHSEHTDHKEEGHGHDENDKDVHSEHDKHGHDEHGDEHNEDSTKISHDMAKKSGVVVAEVRKRTINEHIMLTGRIGQNRNTTFSVPVRFPSIVKKIYVTWGEKVSKGQKLATVQSRANLTPYDIVSPADGIIFERNVSMGDLANDEPLFVIADLSNVWAEFHVFPRDLSRVKEKLQVHVKSLESDNETDASISMILPIADAFSQTVIAVVTIPNEDGKWRPGMTVEGDVHLSGNKKESLAVEKSAIQNMENNDVVFVQEGDEYKMRSVKLGKNDGEYIEILEGIKEGEKYVSKSSFIIKADIGKSAAKHDH